MGSDLAPERDAAAASGRQGGVEEARSPEAGGRSGRSGHELPPAQRPVQVLVDSHL